MDFSYPPEASAFRAEVRAWLDDHLVGELRILRTGFEFSESDWPPHLAREQELDKAGWSGLEWPVQYGGRAVTAMESLVVRRGQRDGTSEDAGLTDAVVEEIVAAGVAAVSNSSDICTWAGAEALVGQAMEVFDGMDVLVNNAGTLGTGCCFR